MLHKLLTLHCLSPLHCGTGQGIAGIDLPIQRERHTGWPVVPGSSIKGVLRDAARQESKESDPHQANYHRDVIALFGPEPKAEQTGELGLGALAFGDGVLLAFPVRSLCGVFAWVTCPLALERLRRVAGMAGITVPACEPLKDTDIYCSERLRVDDKKDDVLLEDHALTRKPLDVKLMESLRSLFPESAQFLVNNHFAVVSDDLFAWFARHATQVEARIALDPATKPVSNGALFYQETVPPESVFVSMISAENARHAAAKDSPFHTASAALAHLETLCKSPRQFGGDATIGKGLCALHLEGK